MKRVGYRCYAGCGRMIYEFHDHGPRCPARGSKVRHECDPDGACVENGLHSRSPPEPEEAGR